MGYILYSFNREDTPWLKTYLGFLYKNDRP